MEKKIFVPVLSLVKLPRLSPAAWLTLSYLILSISWILWSDSIAAKLSHPDHHYLTFENIQVIKGIFFVFLSATLLFLLSRKLYTGIHKSYEQKETIERKFTVLNEMAREGVIDYNFKEEKAILNDKMKFSSLPLVILSVISGKYIKPGFTRKIYRSRSLNLLRL